MSKEHHLFAITGLADYRNVVNYTFQGWQRKFDIIPHVIPVGWNDRSTNFQHKQDLIVQEVRPYVKRDDIITSFLGISAGVGAVVNIWQYLEGEGTHLNGGIVLNCGRLREGSPRGYRTLKRASRNSPAFKESVLQSEPAVERLSPKDKIKILNFYSLLDELVPPSTARIDGARNIRLLTPEHVVSIGVVMTLYAKTVIDHLAKVSETNSK